jgi:hypothetical protein
MEPLIDYFRIVAAGNKTFKIHFMELQEGDDFFVTKYTSNVSLQEELDYAVSDIVRYVDMFSK